MKYIQFATTDVQQAKDNILRAMPDLKKDKHKWFLEYLLKNVSEGIIRVGNPTMYNSSPIFGTDKTSDENMKEIKQNYDNFLKEQSDEEK